MATEDPQVSRWSMGHGVFLGVLDAPQGFQRVHMGSKALEASHTKSNTQKPLRHNMGQKARPNKTEK